MIETRPPPAATADWFNPDEFAGTGHVPHWQANRLPRFVATAFDDERSMTFIHTVVRLGISFEPWTSVRFTEPCGTQRLGFFFSSERDEAVFRLIW